MLAELFPVATRTTGVALSGALSITLFGGFAPLVLAALAGAGETLPSLYLMLGAALAALALLRLRFRAAPLLGDAPVASGAQIHVKPS